MLPKAKISHLNSGVEIFEVCIGNSLLDRGGRLSCVRELLVENRMNHTLEHLGDEAHHCPHTGGHFLCEKVAPLSRFCLLSLSQ